MRELLATIFKIMAGHQLPIENMYWPKALFQLHLKEYKKELAKTGGKVKFQPGVQAFKAYGIDVYCHAGPHVISITRGGRIFTFEIDTDNMEITEYRIHASAFAQKVTTDAQVPGASGT